VHAQGLAEGRIADGLSAIQDRYPAIDLGSYPYYRSSGNGVALVAKGTEQAAVDACIAEVTAMIVALGSVPVQGEPAAG
jgi:molybdopterin-biosynthesis enzyme MoeA-like protein